MNMLAAWRACRTGLSPKMRLAQFPQAWTQQDRSEVARHFAPAAESLLGPTGNGERAVIWALVRWLFVDDDNPHDDNEEDEDVKDEKEALCVLGPGLYNAAVVFGRDCPLPELRRHDTRHTTRHFSLRRLE